MIQANMVLMKDINLNTIRYTMRQLQKATKPQLVELTGLSGMTVNSLVAELCDKGELLEEESIRSKGGRPAVSYRFNSQFRLVLAVCLLERWSRQTLLVSVNDLNGACLESCERKEDEISVAVFDRIVGEYREKYPAISVIAFGMPGFEVGGQILNIPQYQHLEECFFSGYFQREYGVPVIYENDVNLATAGYSYKQKIPKGECVVGVYFPMRFSPGSGIYINGQIYRGKNGAAGEVAYLFSDMDWSLFNRTYPEISQAVGEVIMPMVALYNPHKVVLYGEWLPAALSESLADYLKGQLPEALLPAFVLRRDMRKDFLDGAVHLALKEFEIDLMQ